MSDQPTNPKKIKDLKARLGRGPASGVPGAPASGIPAPGAMGQGAAGPSGVPAPGRLSNPGAAPMRSGVPAPMAGVGPGSVAPPPFVGGGDPFAAASPSAAPYRASSDVRDVRIVVDDAAVEEAGAAKKSTAKTMLVLFAGLVLGLAVGGFVASTASTRKQFSLAIDDARAIKGSVETASAAVTSAKQSIDAAIAKAKGREGAPAVAYEQISALVKIPKPFDANQFAGRRYLALPPATVNDLFTYYNNVNLIWEKVARLGARTQSEARKKALDASAAAAGVMAKPVGCVPSVVEGRLVCGLVFMQPVEGKDDVAAVSTRAGSPQTFEKQVAKADSPIGSTPDEFVVLVDNQRSAGVLAQGANDFAQYVAELSELQSLVDSTLEVQGRLGGSLGEVLAKSGN